MRQTIQLLTENKHGVLMRIIGIITAKGSNIEALTVEPDRNQPATSRIVVVCDMDQRLKQRVVNEMNRLVEVLTAVDITGRGAALEHLEGSHSLLPAQQISDAYGPLAHLLIEGER
jgi:acetolactate synthase-1/3 small subunit